VPYHIKSGYRERDSPSYFVDTPDQAAACQPDVYAEAAALADVLGAHTIVDLGCGLGDKLAALAATFKVIGVDHGVNLEAARARHPEIRLVAWDLEQPSLNLPESRGAVVVCVDVIEHMSHPERLLRLIRRFLEDGAIALVLTTPERDLVRGFSDIGPPENESHVREWNRSELGAFLRQEGLPGYIGLTRSNTSVPWFHTTLVVVPSASADADALARWWEERNRYLGPIEHLQEQSQAASERGRELGDEIAGVRRYVAELEDLRASQAAEISDVRAYVAELEDLRASYAAEISDLRAYAAEVEAERERLLARPQVPATVRGATRLAGENALAAIRERLPARRA